MAVKILYMKTGPATLAKATDIEINQPVGSFRGAGDNTLTSSQGRKGFVTGTVYVEDSVTAQSVIALAAANVDFAVVTDGGDATLTITSFCAKGNSFSLPDGLGPGQQVPRIGVPFIATAFSVA